MKQVKKAAAQGDVLFRRVDKIPAGYERQETKGDIVVAHSETGHHHTVPGANVALFCKAGDPLVSYLQMGDVTGLEVRHHRPNDTHDSFMLKGKSGTVWEIRRQREHTPEGWRRVAD